MLNRPENKDIVDNWQNIVEIMARFMSVPTAVITHVDLPFIEVVKSSRTPGNPYEGGMKVEIAEHYCEAVVQSGKPMLLPNATKSERWKEAPEIEHGMISYMGYPISWPDGEIFGTICVQDSKENPWGGEFEELLKQFRNMVEAHLALMQKNEELERALSEVKVLRGIVPICMHCKRVRDDDGYWQQVDHYLRERSEADFSHGLCPSCAEAMEKDMLKKSG